MEIRDEILVDNAPFSSSQPWLQHVFLSVFAKWTNLHYISRSRRTGVACSLPAHGLVLFEITGQRNEMTTQGLTQSPGRIKSKYFRFTGSSAREVKKKNPGKIIENHRDFISNKLLIQEVDIPNGATCFMLATVCRLLSYMAKLMNSTLVFSLSNPTEIWTIA